MKGNEEFKSRPLNLQQSIMAFLKLVHGKSVEVCYDPRVVIVYTALLH